MSLASDGLHHPDLAPRTLRLGALAAVLLWLLAPEAAARGAGHALSLWWQTLVPALLPFLAAGELYLWGTQGPLHRARPWATRILERILGLSWPSLPALLAGLIGGYPLGAALADRWVARGVIPQEEGARLTALACAPDPLFVAALWAPTLSHAPLLGPILLAIQYVSLIPVLLVVRRPRPPGLSLPNVRKGPGTPASPAPKSGPAQSTVGGPLPRRSLTAAADPLLQGALSAARSLIVLATVLTLLGATAQALYAIAPMLRLSALSPVLADVARAFADGLFVAEEPARLPLSWTIGLTSALASFGGLAVWAETWALTRRTRLDLGPFARARLVQAATSGLLAFWVTRRLWRRLVPGVTVLAPLADHSLSSEHAALAFGFFGIVLLTALRPRRPGDTQIRR